ncbi:cysteine hydrolase [Sporosarcina sp. ACRSL]|uniref:cysteine hydrolase family protein n=1 Tax=Sporosarcina sp. ACRSL TaxID=2918215 RepID=UPI001EF3EA97|nr:cysteine hydrolase family protein [Sporosarcina sp. ACRSL]MCG7343758.1 cysteine hydrolase [Sporosarcina sp. ACRSL]
MKKTGLVIIDVQNAMFMEEDPVYQGEVLLRNIKDLLAKARMSGAPVFFVQHNEAVGQPLENGTYGWEVHPEIAPAEDDTIIQKTTPDSFYKTDFEEQLQNQKIERLVLAGIQTEVCVDTTCRRAFSMGYDVTLVADAHSTWNSGSLSAQQIIDHHNRVLKWFARIKETNAIQFNE